LKGDTSYRYSLGGSGNSITGMEGMAFQTRTMVQAPPLGGWMGHVFFLNPSLPHKGFSWFELDEAGWEGAYRQASALIS